MHTSRPLSEKCVQIPSFLWSVFSRSQSKYGQYGSENSVFGHFSFSAQVAQQLAKLPNYTKENLMFF